MSFRSSLPANSLDPSYAARVLEAVRTGNYSMTWWPVTSAIPGHTAKFWVSADALTIEGLRVTMNAVTETQIGDYLDACLLTSKLADLTWFQRTVTLKPVLLGNTQAQLARITLIATMIEHSEAIDKQLAAMPASARDGLRATVGKDWLIDKILETRPAYGVNYGQYDPAAPYACATSEPGKACKVYQPPSTAHIAKGFDVTYDQIGRWVRRPCSVDGVPRDTLDVMRDPKLAGLASAQGALSIVRQPNVPAPKGPSLWTPPGAAPDVSKCPDAGLGRIVGAVDWGRSPLPPGYPAWAVPIAALPLGTIARDTLAGVPVVGRVECAEASSGYVRAVKLYRPASYNAAGVLVPLMTPSSGWPGS